MADIEDAIVAGLNEVPKADRTMPYEGDMIDHRRAEAYYGPKAGRCVGGRVIFQGFPCPHCDSPNPLSRCKSPKGAALGKWEMPKNG